jgi:AcrR family transcriptional regulator
MTVFAILVICSRKDGVNQLKSENDEREERILSAASDLIAHYGYDKTTVSDIAHQAGVSKGTIYLHFSSKEALFEALLRQEMSDYTLAWLEYIEALPDGGTIGGLYRAALHALKKSPLMSAMLRRDQRVLGSYLRKPGNIFASMQSGSLRADTLRAMQTAGAIREDVDTAVIAHIMELFSYGLVSIDDYRQPEQMPPLEVVIETMGEIMDHFLIPAGGGNQEAGKAIIRQSVAAVRQYLDKESSNE